MPRSAASSFSCETAHGEQQPTDQPHPEERPKAASRRVGTSRVVAHPSRRLRAFRCARFARLLRVRWSLVGTHEHPTALRRHRHRRPGHHPVPALLDQHRALVGRPRGARGGPAGRPAQRRHRRPVAVELHRRPRHRDRPHPASGLEPALARPCAVGRRQRRRRPAPRGARRAVRRCRVRGLRRRRHQPGRFLPPHAVDLLALRPGRRLSLRLGRPQCELRADHPQLHEALRRHARGFRQDLRRPARQCAVASRMP